VSEGKTAETNGSRSFEERVFARFDAVESRIERLEMRHYDTKPIWEQALAAIASTNEHMREGFAEIRIQLDLINTHLDAMDTRFQSIDSRFDAMDARFTGLGTDLDNGLHGVERKLDVLNKYILELRADQRYVDSRLEKIES
jgi:archaellum component FlaC